ncbi:ATP phosphoribosyltransferase regulatory subunit [Angelakisella massiliensis]|uniref:ATP phosphoribosyltransferase regulatory subunit n=1 Tax=Angelakisella massiliensis TaxID=1871018 RepID=UPI0023A8DB5D|nr:ATP phosphoribosyltransferase regulatory subunit [Angelakisella massiliensis]
MKRFDKVTPEGTRDLLFEDCAVRQRLTNRLTELYHRRGYRQIITPGVEFYDVFTLPSSGFPQDSMYKLSDNRSRLMVLRPDCTIPIARLAATRLAGMAKPLRIYYAQNVYRMEQSLRGRLSEIWQAGVELIGDCSLRSDLEMVELAASSLAGLGPGSRIELCHIGYFRAVIGSLEADTDTKEEIRQCVEQKNYAALGNILDRFPGDPAAAALRKLPRLFGGEEVFEEAAALFGENGAAESLGYLRDIYEALCRLGLSDQILIDLGLVNQAEYYTGIVFRGYLDGVGEPVLSGGRYDNLLRDFGEPCPAIGFAVELDPVAAVTEHLPSPPADALVFADEKHLPQAIQCIKELTAQGKVVENCLLDDVSQAIAYGRQQGIPLLYVAGEDQKPLDLTVEGGGDR